MSETDRILNDIRVYLRITAAAASRNITAKTVDSQEKAIVYSKMDGKTSQSKIESATSIPQQTISRWTDEFVAAGLASQPNEYFTMHRALFTLQELGINMSELKKRGKPKVEKASSTLDYAIEQKPKEEERK